MGRKSCDPHQQLMRNRLYHVDQDHITYSAYEIDTLTQIIDTVMDLNNMIIADEQKFLIELHIITWRN